ncbi:MAG: hypothetical protein WCP03_00845 [Candidatus Saccharibacteria bacterium]
MNIETIISKLQPVKIFIVRYAVIIFIIATAGIFGFMTLQISRYSNAEPTSDQIEEKKNSLKKVKLNDKAVEKIQELEDKNINIESLFNNGRDNPFE